MKFAANSIFSILVFVASVAGCTNSKDKTHDVWASSEVSVDGETWVEGYSSNGSGEDEAAIRARYLKTIRENAVTSCHLSNPRRVRGFIAMQSTPVDKKTAKPEFDLTCDEVLAKKTEWGIQ
jgi:hypothetical protein